MVEVFVMCGIIAVMVPLGFWTVRILNRRMDAWAKVTLYSVFGHGQIEELRQKQAAWEAKQEKGVERRPKPARRLRAWALSMCRSVWSMIVFH